MTTCLSYSTLSFIHDLQHLFSIETPTYFAPVYHSCPCKVCSDFVFITPLRETDNVPVKRRSAPKRIMVPQLPSCRPRYPGISPARTGLQINRGNSASLHKCQHRWAITPDGWQPQYLQSPTVQLRKWPDSNAVLAGYNIK